jgi:hypothetical protein
MWGSFAGPVFAGAIYDRTQSYMIVFVDFTQSPDCGNAIGFVFDPAVEKPDNGN